MVSFALNTFLLTLSIWYLHQAASNIHRIRLMDFSFGIHDIFVDHQVFSTWKENCGDNLYLPMLGEIFKQNKGQMGGINNWVLAFRGEEMPNIINKPLDMIYLTKQH